MVATEKYNLEHLNGGGGGGVPYEINLDLWTICMYANARCDFFFSITQVSGSAYAHLTNPEVPIIQFTCRSPNQGRN